MTELKTKTGLTEKSNESGQVHLIMAVWGRSYVDLFLDLSLPSQLSARNLPEASQKGNLLYKIFTTRNDVEQITQHPAFKRLSSLVETKIISVEDINKNDKFSPLMAFHNQAIQEADAANAALIFLSPDFIIADGTLLKLIELWQAGYRAVMVLTLRLTKETVKDELLKKYYNDQDHTLQALPRELVRLCLKHIHPIEKTYFWGSRFSSFPIHAYWPVKDEGLTARCYYLHPLMINPLVKYVLPNITIDADYVDLACSNRSLIHIVQDSDELCCFELTSAAAHDANAPKPPTLAKEKSYARWATVHANPVFDSLLHHMYFQVPIRIHSGPITKKWLKVERRAKKTARRVRLWTFFLRRHGNLTNALDFYWATKFKSPPLNSLFQSDRIPGVQRCWNGYQIDFYDFCTGNGWGPAEKNAAGQQWCWINPDGQSSISLKIRTKKSYVLKTLIHTALGDSLYKLEVLIDDQPALQQQIISQRQQIWHWCILPKRMDSDEVVLTFRLNPAESGDRLALSLSILKLTLCDPRIVYGDFRRKFGHKVKSMLGYPNV